MNWQDIDVLRPISIWPDIYYNIVSMCIFFALLCLRYKVIREKSEKLLTLLLVSIFGMVYLQNKVFHEGASVVFDFFPYHAKY